MTERITEADYQAELRSIIDSARTEYDEATPFEDALSQIIDGHDWVIYTWQARQVRSLSSNPNAFYDEGFEDDPEVNPNQRDSLLAFWALYNDCSNLAPYHDTETQPQEPTE